MSVPHQHSTNLQFQYVSDLHLDLLPDGYQPECWKQLIPKQSPNLILAGDIAELSWCYYQRFLEYCCEVWDQVFYIPGNHEYYGYSLYQGESILNTLFYKLPKNFHNLKNQHITMDNNNNIVSNPNPPENNQLSNVHLLGCVLWSYISPLSEEVCKKFIADFTSIKSFTINQYNFYHDQDVKWLQSEIKKIIKKNPQDKMIVVTHHAPLIKGTSPHKYESDPMYKITNCAFSSNQSRLLSLLPSGSHWIYGHTHFRKTFSFENALVHTWAIGYKNEINENNNENVCTFQV